jgi:hypothetical protein
MLNFLLMKRQRSQLRKYLFYGLTLVLLSALIFLVIQGRRLEKEQVRQGNANIQKFKSTPIRVLSPQDLKILNASMTLEPANVPGELPAARHNFEIYNAGTVSYSEIQLRLDYLDAHGEVIASIPYDIKDSIPPGGTLVSNDILIQTIPDATVECRPSIVYGDFEPVESEQENK